MTAIDVYVPDDILEALEYGELSYEQLRELARIEAAAIGMSLDEAISAAHQRALPKNPIGMDLESLILMLEYNASPTH
jgi:hypothetical protein